MKKLLALVAAGTLLAGCGLTAPSISNDTPKFGAKRVLPKNAKKWTILVHLAADNNLYSFGLQDLNEIEAGINTDDVNVIVLFDGTKQGDSAVYEMKRDANGKNATVVSTALDVPFIPASKEIDSGDVKLVQEFGEWAVQKYPAQHYMVSFWDHGSGIFRKGVQNTFFDTTKGFGWDDNGSHMNTSDLSTLIPSIAKKAGQPIDMVGFDACLMAHAEIGYQVKGYADYLVASEELEPGAGWDYELWLKNVNRGTSPAQLGTALVQSYAQSYAPGGSQNPGGRPQDITLSVMDIKALTSKLVPAMNNFATALTAALPAEKATLQQVRGTTQSFYNKDCADIGHFAKQVQASNVSAGVKQAAGAVQQAVASTVISEMKAGKCANATGVVVYFPNATQMYNAKYSDPNAIAFANEGWKDFLKAFTKK